MSCEEVSVAAFYRNFGWGTGERVARWWWADERRGKAWFVGVLLPISGDITSCIWLE